MRGTYWGGANADSGMTSISEASKRLTGVVAVLVTASAALAPALAAASSKPKPADSAGVSQYIETVPSATGDPTPTAGVSSDSSGVSQYVEQVPRAAGTSTTMSNTRKLLLAVVAFAVLTVATVAARLWLRRPRPVGR